MDGSDQLQLLFDADAFLAVRKLGILDDLLDLAREGKLHLNLTRYIARHDLSSLQTFLGQIEAGGLLSVHVIPADSEAARHYDRLQKNPKAKSGRPIHKGEREAVSWAYTSAREVFFVSCDQGARDLAEEHRLRCGDVLDLVITLLEAGLVSYDTMRQRLEFWQGKRSGPCVPKEGYNSLEEALAYRRR